jgi:hypothetical protein
MVIALRIKGIEESPMGAVLSYIQLIANLSALILIGGIYAAYVKNLRSSVDLKNTELDSLRTNLQLWRDKAEQLEKRTPEYLERLLSERIKIREEELARLKNDSEQHQQEIRERNSELEGLRYELQKAKDVGRNVIVYDGDTDTDSDRVLKSSELELVKMGEVFVDAACLMICDPSYIGKVWRDYDWGSYPRVPPRYIDTTDGEIYEVGREITDLDKPLTVDPRMTDIDMTVPVCELIRTGRLNKLTEPSVPPPHQMSTQGAIHASAQPYRYGSLAFLNGEEGAGICFATAYGDGTYPVYGEKFKDRIVRVYVDLL